MNRPLPCRIDFFLSIFGFLLFFSSNVFAQTVIPGINRIEILAVLPDQKIVAAGYAEIPPSPPLPKGGKQ